MGELYIRSPQNGGVAKPPGLLVVKGVVRSPQAGERIEIGGQIVVGGSGDVRFRRPGTPPPWPRFTYVNDRPELFFDPCIVVVTVRLLNAKGEEVDRARLRVTVRPRGREGFYDAKHRPDYVLIDTPEDGAENVGGGTHNFTAAGYMSLSGSQVLEAFLTNAVPAQHPAAALTPQGNAEDYDWMFVFNGVPGDFRDDPVDLVVWKQDNHGVTDTHSITIS